MTTPTPTPRSEPNPWIFTLVVASVPVALAGIALTLINLDGESVDFDPVAAALGHTLLIVTGVLLAGALAAGAINWQLRRR